MAEDCCEYFFEFGKRDWWQIYKIKTETDKPGQQSECYIMGYCSSLISDQD